MNNGNHQETILIVEDSRTQIEELKYLLEKQGYKVFGASNGREALRLLQEIKPDIIVSDIMMPEMNGYEFCKMVRGLQDYKDIPVILVTSLSDPIDVIKGLDAGANNFLTKPYDGKYLTARIQYLLTNVEIRKNTKADMGVNVFFAGQTFSISAERLQILDLLLSTYENAYHQNLELRQVQQELRELNEGLEETVAKRTEALSQELAEHKKTEQLLGESEQQFRSIFDSYNDGLMVTNIADHNFLFGNPMISKMLGYDKEEIRHISIKDIHPEDALPHVFAQFARQVAGEITIAENIPVQRKDGSTFYADINTSSITIHGKSYLIGAFRDVSERRRLHEAEIARLAADASNKAKSDFLANMSHELRTPLNSIIGFSELLGDGLVGPLTEQQKSCTDDIHNGGVHLLSLINDILDLSKVEAGKMELDLSSFLLCDVFDAAFSMLKGKAFLHEIHLSELIEGGREMLITADVRKVKQIIFNLLSNAVKFTPDGGSVAIQAKVVDDFVEISVTDTGIGINPQDMPRLFHEFSQVESPYTKTYEGTGLGLALSKKLVELHGGRLWAESEFGKGSRFTFLLPLKSGGDQ